MESPLGIAPMEAVREASSAEIAAASVGAACGMGSARTKAAMLAPRKRDLVNMLSAGRFLNCKFKWITETNEEGINGYSERKGSEGMKSSPARSGTIRKL